MPHRFARGPGRLTSEVEASLHPSARGRWPRLSGHSKRADRKERRPQQCAVAPHDGGHCARCAAGWEMLCEAQQNTEYSVNGGFAEYVIADPNFVGHLPNHVHLIEVAPVLCAGISAYNQIRVTDTRPGNWVVISGIAELGQMPGQYAMAVGRNVAVVDIDDAKLALARSLGAAVTLNAKRTDPVTAIRGQIGEARGAPGTAVSPRSFERTLGLVRRGGTVSLTGLPPGEFPLPIFDVVLDTIPVCGATVGTRLDLLESLEFAGPGKVTTTAGTEKTRTHQQRLRADAEARDLRGHRSWSSGETPTEDLRVRQDAVQFQAA
jgi:alcohol dehydrogenase, propanol-preferring